MGQRTAPATARIEIPYGDHTVTLDLASERLKGVFAPNALPAVVDVAAEVRRALQAPIDDLPLSALARGAQRVVIVADDNTRPTPTETILPVMLDALNEGGVRDGQITVLIALGTHRPMTEAEIELKFGAAVTQRVAVVNHNAFDPAQLVDLGMTPSGVSVQVSRRVVEADLVLGVGSIVPHHIPGFSGGAKIIQPGVCGERTTGEVHLLSVRRERSLLGVLENQVRAEMEDIAERAGLRAILNTVIDSDGRVVGAVYGAPRRAFRTGAALSQRVYGVVVDGLADIVVASSHPCDSEFWQAHKTLYAAELCVREGGTIIVVTPCPEGVSATHPELTHFAGGSPEEIDSAIRRGEIPDLTAGALALAWANTRRRAAVSLVSGGIRADDARALGFTPYDTLAEALAAATERHGSNSSVSVLPFAPDTLPMVH
jgi:nickel-dependent lactate racemase